jgi:hypothetical protein
MPVLVSLLLTASPGLHLQSFKTIDGRRAAEITFKDVDRLRSVF